MNTKFFGDAWRCPGKIECHQLLTVHFGDTRSWPAKAWRHQLLTIFFILAVLLSPAVAIAQGPAINSKGLTWPAAENELTLTISGPDGFYFQSEFNAGNAPFFSLASRLDGLYRYELAGSEDVQSGYFSISGGVLVPADLAEGGPEKDQVIGDDLIVAGSACVGLECINDESFDFDTLRLKEDNIRLEFQDTSDTANFPTRDWRITINDTANGGASRFSIDSVDNGQTPVTVEYGAPDHSLYIDDAGRLGVGTSVPLGKFYVKNAATINDFVINDNYGTVGIGSTDVPHNGIGLGKIAIHGPDRNDRGPHIQFTTTVDNYPIMQIMNRTHDNASLSLDSYWSGPDATWHSADPGSNYQLFKNIDKLYIRYATGITAGTVITWNNGLVLNTNGNIGLGTETPSGPLEVYNGSQLLLLSATGNLTIAGVLSESSDRMLKENFTMTDKNDILARLAAMPISTWNFKAEGPAVQHLGPMAQDFRQAFGLGYDDKHIAPLDTNGVALAAIQALYQKSQADEARIATLEARIATLERMVEALTGETVKPIVEPPSQYHQVYFSLLLN